MRGWLRGPGKQKSNSLSRTKMRPARASLDGGGDASPIDRRSRTCTGESAPQAVLPFHEGVAPRAMPVEGATQAPLIWRRFLCIRVSEEPLRFDRLLARYFALVSARRARVRVVRPHLVQPCPKNRSALRALYLCIESIHSSPPLELPFPERCPVFVSHGARPFPCRSSKDPPVFRPIAIAGLSILV